MSRRYPQAFHDFMQEYIPGHTAREIAAEAKKRLGIDITPSATAAYCKNHKINRGTPGGLPKGTPSDTFPRHVVDYILANHDGVGPTEMAGRLNAEFGTSYTVEQVKGYYKNHKISSGLTGRFKKGNVPANKGKIGICPEGCKATQFKPGDTPYNKLPIGTVLEKSDGYLWRKIGEGARDWRQEHILRWEEVNGPLPEGGKLTFLDGDKHNVDVSNLKLIDNDVNLELNRRRLRTGDRELNETAILIATLSVSASRAKKKGAHHERDHQQHHTG